MEAAMVAYLRELIEPLRRAHFSWGARQALRMLTAEQLLSAGQQYTRPLEIEITGKPAHRIQEGAGPGTVTVHGRRRGVRVGG
jgi:hypothetical protein